MAENRIRVSLVKSVAGARREHRETVRGLGLRRLNSSVELVNTPEIQGMIKKVSFLVRCGD